MTTKASGNMRRCALCLCAGAGTALGSHLVTCVALPAMIAGTAGTAMAAALMPASPLFCPPLAAGLVAAADKWRGRPPSWVRMGGSAVTALAVTLLILWGMRAGAGREEQAHHHAGAVMTKTSTAATAASAVTPASGSQ